MTQPFDPRTSATAKPGYIYNPNKAGQTNVDWQESLIDLLSYKWAASTPEQRQTFLGTSWESTKYGEPGGYDTILEDGKQVTSPATTTALSRYAAAYRPGMDPYIDQVLPYIAPSADDYMEGPSLIAARVAQSNADKAYELAVDQEKRLEK